MKQMQKLYSLKIAQSVTNQITADRAIRYNKAEHGHLERDRWRTLSLRWFFVDSTLY